MLKEKIGFVGCGQAGGNIVKNFEDNGYNCMFVNSSEKDLDTIDAKFKLHIPNANGCSKLRDKAILQAKKHHRIIVDEVNDKLSDCEFVYLVTSSGGGSGSGMTPILLDILTASLPQISFGCIVVIPSKKETIQTQINSVVFFQQLIQVENLKSVIVLDNEKDNKFLINNIIYQLFDDMLKIPDYISTLSNLDESEILQLINTPGNLMIVESYKGNTPSIIKSIEENIYAPIDKDKEVKYLGLSLLNEVDVNDIIKYVGVPLDTYQGYNKDKSMIIMSGLSLPMSRINEMNDIAKGNREIIFKNKKKPELIDTGWLTEDVAKSIEVVAEPSNLDDLFAKY